MEWPEFAMLMTATVLWTEEGEENEKKNYIIRL